MQPSPTTDAPNIVLILADDMGFSDIGAYGSEINTPHLDALARDGLRMTQFYNVPRCCPTRASLLSGLYSHQVGVGHMIDEYAKGIRQRANSAAYSDHLNRRCLTVAELLQTANYRTYLSGKWHLGYDDGQRPQQRGFDRSYALIPGASNYFQPKPDSIRLDDVPINPDGDFYITDAFSDYSIEFLREHHENHQAQPFFLYAAYTAPHWPLQARDADIEKYRGKYLPGWDALGEARHQRQIEAGIVEARWRANPLEPGIKAWGDLTPEKREDFALRMAVYAAQVESMDRGIGRVFGAKSKAMGAD